MMKPKILIVEDANDLRMGLVVLLRLIGYDAHGESTPGAGLQRLLEGGTDLVISDWMFGRVTAESMLVQANDAGALEGVGVIIHTGWSHIERPSTLAHAVIVTKSARSETLMRTIARMLPGTLDPQLERELFVPWSAAEAASNLAEWKAEQDRPAVRTAIGVRNRVQSAK
jgi:DNA-binding NtrC family response regulator